MKSPDGQGLEWWGIPRDCSAREDRLLHVLFRLEGKQG